MGRQVGNESVVLRNPKTSRFEQFYPGDELPGWAQELVGDHVYADSDESESASESDAPAKKSAPAKKRAAAKKAAADKPPADDASDAGDAGADDADETDGGDTDDDGDAGDSAVPPRGGPGSGAGAWAAYAQTLGVEVADDAGRDDIIDAIAAAGHPVE